ncbi:unnamed protein product [Brachionus calyciflorus]|uniref:Inner centromere protein ARK-binding domain-containing protein n=1 Tax=Brachionus calyciflorus TaxID=104777 RepID=A0A814DIM3_9BILA|nr:unnamed protein product [Brachionus calyciflorus]
MSKKKYELEARIRQGEFGAATQFLYSSEAEFRFVFDFSHYEKIWTKYEMLKHELHQMISDAKRNSTSQPQVARLNALTEKYKTPFEKRTFSLFNHNNNKLSSESYQSRKRTAEDIDHENEQQTTKLKRTKKTSKKSKKVKKKILNELTTTTTNSPEPKKPKKSKLEEKLEHSPKHPPKTPLTNRLSNKLIFNSTIKKTVKVKPLTRRAAAALAAAKQTQEGHVKKLVLNIESKIAPTPQAQRKLQPVSSIQKTITKLKAIRSSIDKRKSALSVSKLAIKRKSEKQVKAFLTDLKQESKILITDQANNRISISSKTPGDERLIKEIITKSPKLVLAKIPSNLTHSNSISANLVGKLMEKTEKRLSKDLNSNTSILNNYRPVNLKSTVSYSAIKQTPSKPLFGSCGNLTNQNLYSKFTTPGKLRSETDEKKKAELQAKELKEKERLAELERAKQLKLDEAKKKRDEKLKKVNEVKQKQKEDAELKAKEIELKEKQRVENEKMKKLNSTFNNNNNNNNNSIMQKVMASGQKKILNPINLNVSTKPTVVINKENCNEFVQQFKKSLLTAQKLQKQKTMTLLKTDDKALEQTYVLNSPVKKIMMNSSNYECTPLQPPKLRDEDNYDVSDIRSDDDTDDDEEPSKPIPAWAKEPLLGQKAQDQCLKAINFTRLFKSACKTEINLEQIFKSKRRKFVERSSSANWTTPPVWQTNGISGEESFMQLRKNF